jgi:AIG2-like family
MIVRYFAYGSNMSLSRLRNRVPDARRVGTYTLPGHSLRFHKTGTDGSGKCDAFATDDGQDAVIGALFEIPLLQKKGLDEAEGLGRGYDEKSVMLLDDSGLQVEAVTYIATAIDETLKPFSWYMHHVLIGAGASGLPESYVENISVVNCIEDHDRQRDARERAIHD